ncbi:serine/threonine-protein kinase [Chamaesiphon sp. VAR_69_metabat_338]|uniref:serine/threonine protein kinase n=1 Tax=Chamaesiphon sp. VAR_69_metabat_338 TaxID=2964704 RepID=UPI00286DCECB|nr:serine/threonine-protein kinase [Chamaesiphon sp. VAR_69_metabat_338]
MSDFPDFSPQGYQVLRELGRNASGGRVVYLCETLAEPIDRVVIKQFQFARGSGWSQFKEIEREMQVLKDLEHSGIPRYIGSIQTDDGYSIVQEFKDAQALSIPRSFDPDRIKQIAVAVLEILVYLQARIPVVIHRDIKPENVLVDEDVNVYLIDFGFARIGGGEVAMSSVAAGTFGFMAPEQMYNKGLTTATDLYGLGAMLIALLTQTKSTKMDALIDEDGKIAFQHLTPKLSLSFIKWLEKMVAPRVGDRYPDAESALAALQPIYVIRDPFVQFSHTNLQFQATKLGEKISKTMTIVNTTADTLLEGNWSIEPHPYDSGSSDRLHKWISFSSRVVKGNRVDCEITVDTSKLAAQSRGTRSIVLHSNAVPNTHSISLEVSTAPLSVQMKKLPYAAMVVFWLFAFGCGQSLNVSEAWQRAEVSIAVGFLMPSIAMVLASNAHPHPDGIKIRTFAGAIMGGICGLISGSFAGFITGATFGGFAGFIAGGINNAKAVAGVVIGLQAIAGAIFGSALGFFAGCFAAAGAGAGIITGAIVGLQAGIIGYLYDGSYAELPESSKYGRGFIFIVLETIAIFGLDLGVWLGKANTYLMLITLGAAAGLAYLLLYLPSRQFKQIEIYRQRQKQLIKL